MDVSECTQPYFELQVQYDRQVRGCCYYTGAVTRWDPESDFDLERFWNGPTFRTMRAVIASNRAEGTGCGACQFLKYGSTPGFLSPPDRLDARQRANWDRAISNYRQRRLVIDSLPVKYYFNFGLACNLRCVMCSQQPERQTDRRELPAEPLLRLKDYLATANEVALIGGEPLVLPPARRFIQAMIDDAALSNVQLTLFTNGALLHSFLDRLQALNRVNIVVSLDSLGDAYDHIRRGARWDQTSGNVLAFRDLAARHNLSWGANISGVVMKSSLARLDEFVRWCVEHDLPVHFVPLSPQDFMREEDIFTHPALLQDIPGWEDIFDRAIEQLNRKGWTGAGAHPLTVMKSQLQTAWARFQAEADRNRPVPKPSAPADADESRARRETIGRLLNRAEPLSETELADAERCLAAILDDPRSVACAAQHRAALPPAVLPLILLGLQEAQARGDARVVDALQAIYCELALGDAGPAPGAPASPTEGGPPKARDPEPADAFAPLRARLGRMLGLPGPLPEPELHAANLALAELIDCPDPAGCVAERRDRWPASLEPLLLVHLADAWAEADSGLSCALERLHLLLESSRRSTLSPASPAPTA